MPIVIFPQIHFPNSPIIYDWIKFEYYKLKSYDEIVEFAFKCLEESENSTNQIRSEAYYNTFNVLYQIITGMSYQSVISV